MQAKYLWASILLQAQSLSTTGHIADCNVILGEQILSLGSILESLQVKSLGLISAKYESAIAGYLLALSIETKTLSLGKTHMRSLDLEGNEYCEAVRDALIFSLNIGFQMFILLTFLLLCQRLLEIANAAARIPSLRKINKRYLAAKDEKEDHEVIRAAMYEMLFDPEFSQV
jgi:hypothetical protein